MTEDGWRLLLAVLAVVISLAAFGFSIVAFRRGLPKLRIEAGKAMVFEPQGDPRGVIVVRVANNGGSSAHISGVTLNATDGSHREYPMRVGGGPSMPHELAANGGRASWFFDHAQLRQHARDQVRDEPLRVRATVQVGSNHRRQRGRIDIAPAGSTADHRSLNGRLLAWIRSWTHPGVGLYPFASDFDLINRTGTLTLLNAGRGFTRPSKLTLTVQHADGHRDRVVGYDPVRVPRIWPRSQITLRVPLVNPPDVGDGDTFTWSSTRGKGIGGGYGATTYAEAEEFVKQSKSRTEATDAATEWLGDIAPPTDL